MYLISNERWDANANASVLVRVFDFPPATGPGTLAGLVVGGAETPQRLVMEQPFDKRNRIPIEIGKGDFA
jgi:hypothetical protein